MKLNIILTSYNRPNLLQMAIDSLLAQTDNRWACYLQDDNSNDETLRVIEGLGDDDRFIVGTHNTGERDRQNTTRYSVLINEVLPDLKSGVVCTMCDNVTYEPNLIKTVLTWFENNPGETTGYVPQLRDMWHMKNGDAAEYMGIASEFGHWLIVPPEIGKEVTAPYGRLDHSQVFNRCPVDLRWEESNDAITFGDANFYVRLIKQRGAIQCITTEILSCEHLLYERIHP